MARTPKERRKQVPELARPVGRPLKLTPSIEATLLEAFENGASVSGAARAAGIHPNTLCDWLAIGRGQYTGWRTGDETSADTLELFSKFSARVDEITAQNEIRCTKAMLDAVGLPLKGGSIDWRAGLEYLKHHQATRDSFHPARHETTTHVTVEQIQPDYRQAAALPAPDVIEVMPGSWRELTPASGEMLREPSSDD